MNHKLSKMLMALTIASASNMSATEPIYLDRNAPIEKRVEDALSRMTLEEKVALCHAHVCL